MSDILFHKALRDGIRRVIMPKAAEKPTQIPYYPPTELHLLLASFDILDILEEMHEEPIYTTAWDKLHQVFGEQLRHEDMDIMDSVLKGVKLEIEDNQKAREEAGHD